MNVIILKSLLFLIGLLILIVALPHGHPWRSTRIITSGELFQNVTIKLPILDRSFTTAGANIFLYIFLGFIFLFVVLPSTRKRVAYFLKSPRQLVSVMVPATIFLFTLYPTKNGLPIVLYLMLSSLGISFIMFAAFKILMHSYEWNSARYYRNCIWNQICNRFLTISPFFFMLSAFIIMFATTVFFSNFLFEQIPHVQDNIAQLFHAKIFLSGNLTAPSHKYKEFFEFTHMINNGRWYSIYPPGHTFMLLLGLIIGAPWIINPLLGSMSIVIFYLLGKELYDERTGRLAALLGILSPFIIFMSSEFFNHATTLFYSALFSLLFFKTLKKSNLLYPLFAGISLGISLNARPLTAVGIGLPYSFYVLYLIITERKIFFTRFAVMFSGFLLMAAVLTGFNYLTNGHPQVSGYEVLYGKKFGIGFGHSGFGPPHSPEFGLLQTLNDLNALNKYLFEWCIPSTFFVMLFFMGSRKNRGDYILLNSAISLSFVYFFYWYQGWCFGPRLIYESTCPLILLTARGIIYAPAIVKEKFKAISSENQLRYATNTIIGFCMLIALFINVPSLIRLYSRNYWGINAKIAHAVKKTNIKNTVVFVTDFYSSVFPLNSPLLNGDVIYAQDFGPKNELLMKDFPHRRYYVVTRKNDIEEISLFSYRGPFIPNGDFEKGTFIKWAASGNAWGLTKRARVGRSGNVHAESLIGGEKETGTLRSEPFEISGNLIFFLKNGFQGKLKSNCYVLKDVQTGEVLREASPPNQDQFAPHIWFVSDINGRRVYFEIVDNDDDMPEKDGYAWLGIDAIRQSN